jgi:hypothetical protein
MDRHAWIRPARVGTDRHRFMEPSTIAEREGATGVMELPVSEPESGITTELVDLAAVPLSALRYGDAEPLRAAVRHVVEQAGRARVNRDGTKGGGALY